MEYRVYLLLFMTSITGYVLSFPETASCPLTLKAVFDQVNCSDTTIQFQHLTNYLNSLNANITGKMCNTTQSWAGNCYKETFDRKAVYTVNITGNCSIPAFENDTVKLGGALCYQAVTSCPLIITAPFDETTCGSTHEKNASLQIYIKKLVGQNATISSVSCTIIHGFEDNDCRKMIPNYSVAGDKAVYKVSVTGTCSIPQWVILDDAENDNRSALCYNAELGGTTTPTTSFGGTKTTSKTPTGGVTTSGKTGLTSERPKVGGSTSGKTELTSEEPKVGGSTSGKTELASEEPKVGGGSTSGKTELTSEEPKVGGSTSGKSGLTSEEPKVGGSTSGKTEVTSERQKVGGSSSGVTTTSPETMNVNSPATALQTQTDKMQQSDTGTFPWWVLAVAVGCVAAAGLGVLVYKKLNNKNQVGDDGSTSSIAGFFDVGFDEAPNSAPPAGTC